MGVVVCVLSVFMRMGPILNWSISTFGLFKQKDASNPLIQCVCVHCVAALQMLKSKYKMIH